MTGLDTNILVRYITQDDPILSPKSTHLLEHQLTERDPGYISLVALAETAWVLGSVYDLPLDDVADTLEHILQIDVLLVQNAQEVFTAIVAMRDRKASFAGALIGALGLWAGCSSTVTFDR